MLKSVGILPEDEHVSRHISSPAQDKLAFGSLVRCSLSRLDEKSGKWLTSGNLITKSFAEVPEVLSRCGQTFLANLPERTRVVVLLGVGDTYVKRCFELIRAIYPDLQKINEVAYGSASRLFVHLTHPSPGNGTFNEWLSGGSKQVQAEKVIARYLPGAGDLEIGAPTIPPPQNSTVTRQAQDLPVRPNGISPEGNSEAARALLQQMFPSTELCTKYIASYTTAKGRQIGIERNRSSGYYVWSELYESSISDVVVRNSKNPGQPYASEQSRNSNLNDRTAPRLKLGNKVFYLHIPTLKTLEKFVRWYADH